MNQRLEVSQVDKSTIMSADGTQSLSANNKQNFIYRNKLEIIYIPVERFFDESGVHTIAFLTSAIETAETPDGSRPVSSDDIKQINFFIGLCREILDSNVLIE